MKFCLIIGQGELPNIIKYESLKTAYEKLLEIDDVLFFFKKHPGEHASKEYYNIFKNCIQLDRHIPVELFFPHMIHKYVKSCVVSPYSTASSTAYRFGIKVVSLLDLVDWCSEENKSSIYNLLMKLTNGKICFPSSFNELNKLINDLE